MGTPYSKENKAFTDKCHLLAQKLVYPRLFNMPVEKLVFEDNSLGTTKKNTILDGQMAVDRTVRVKKDGFNSDIEFLIQERFRKPGYANYRDITITEWNTITDLPSELYKLNAGLFVYGYANKYPDPTDFIEVVIVDTAKMIISIIRDDFVCGLEENYRTEQTFITIPFVVLFDAGCIVSTYKREDAFEVQTQAPQFSW